jgi:hypothetical protein
MSPLDPEIPEAGEEIHLPGPSTQPVLIALGLALALVGVTFNIVLVVVGLGLTIWQTVKWIRETRQDISALPQADPGGGSP